MNTDTLILAAGLSKRFNYNKLMYSHNGRPLMDYSLCICNNLLKKSTVSSVTVVTSHDDTSEFIRKNYPGFNLTLNEHPENGISSSIKAGLKKIITANSKSQSCLILLADMPFLDNETIENLLKKINSPKIEIAACREKGSASDDFRNPAVFKNMHYEKLLLLNGDKGAKSVIKSLYKTKPDALGIIDTDYSVLRDIDTKDDLSTSF